MIVRANKLCHSTCHVRCCDSQRSHFIPRVVYLSTQCAAQHGNTGTRRVGKYGCCPVVALISLRCGPLTNPATRSRTFCISHIGSRICDHHIRTRPCTFYIIDFTNGRRREALEGARVVVVRLSRSMIRDQGFLMHYGTSREMAS